MNRIAGSSAVDRWRDQGLECDDYDIAELGNLLRRTRVDICEVVDAFFQETLVALLSENVGATVVRYGAVI